LLAALVGAIALSRGTHDSVDEPAQRQDEANG